MGTRPGATRVDGVVALTGTPGTGKSEVGRRLARDSPVWEVAELAVRAGAARRLPRGAGYVVDVPRLRRVVGRTPPLASGTLLVGHLAHLLPASDVVVLRCRPDLLVGRLRRARRGSRADRGENYLAEALDVVLLEAVGGRHQRVWEVDTTGRSIAEVARIVRGLLERRPPSRYGDVDWLADRRVVAHLLDPPG